MFNIQHFLAHEGGKTLEENTRKGGSGHRHSRNLLIHTPDVDELQEKRREADVVDSFSRNCNTSIEPGASGKYTETFDFSGNNIRLQMDVNYPPPGFIRLFRIIFLIIQSERILNGPFTILGSAEQQRQRLKLPLQQQQLRPQPQLQQHEQQLQQQQQQQHLLQQQQLHFQMQHLQMGQGVSTLSQQMNRCLAMMKEIQVQAIQSRRSMYSTTDVAARHYHNSMFEGLQNQYTQLHQQYYSLESLYRKHIKIFETMQLPPVQQDPTSLPPTSSLGDNAIPPSLLIPGQGTTVSGAQKQLTLRELESMGAMSLDALEQNLLATRQSQKEDITSSQSQHSTGASKF